MKAALLTAAVSLVLAGSAAAAAPLFYATPVSIAAKITGAVPQLVTDNTSAPTVITATTCRGLGAAKKGKYNTFRCKSTYGAGTATVWARALAGGRFCASSTGLASCPAVPPTAGDPRLCTDPPAPVTADPDRCGLRAAESALTRVMTVSFSQPGWTPRNVSCKGKNLAYSCQFSSMTAYGTYYASTITFTQAAGVWTATYVTTGATTPGAGGTTCTTQTTGKAGAASDWSAGPTPVCTNN